MDEQSVIPDNKGETTCANIILQPIEGERLLFNQAEIKVSRRKLIRDDVQSM